MLKEWLDILVTEKNRLGIEVIGGDDEENRRSCSGEVHREEELSSLVRGESELEHEVDKWIARVAYWVEIVG